jgi:biopolymer transport protein ExbB/TolQ
MMMMMMIMMMMIIIIIIIIKPFSISVFLFITPAANIFYSMVVIHLCLFRKLYQFTYKINWKEALQKTKSHCSNDIKRQTEEEYKHCSIKVCRCRTSFADNN